MKIASLLEVWHAFACFIGIHEWGEEEDRTDVIGYMGKGRACAWCRQWYQTVAPTPSMVEEQTQITITPALRRMLEIQDRGELYRVPTRKPAGPFRGKALGEFVRSRVNANLRTTPSDEVVRQIMAAGIRREEPLASTGRDLATGAVKGLGPMKGGVAVAVWLRREASGTLSGTLRDVEEVDR